MSQRCWEIPVFYPNTITYIWITYTLWSCLTTWNSTQTNPKGILIWIDICTSESSCWVLGETYFLIEHIKHRWKNILWWGFKQTDKQKTEHKCWYGWGEIGTLVHCWRKCKKVQLLWKTIRWFLKNLKITIWSRNSTSGYVPKRTGSRDSNRYCTPVSIAALFIIAKMSIEGLEDKQNGVCTHIMGYHSALKRKKFPSHASAWMDLEDTMRVK